MIGMKEYILAEGVVAFSTTRKGGVSEGTYGSFNINPYCGDSQEHIAENRRILAEKLGVDVSHIVLPHQVHGTEVRRLDDHFLSFSADEQECLLDGVDAVMTHSTDVCIGVSTADCIPVLLYDDTHHAVAAVHAGWRGTVMRIVRKTVDAMHAAYHTQPEQLKAVIGPGISKKSFEVGNEVYEEFCKAGFDMETIAEKMPVMNQTAHSGTPWKWHIDLPLCNSLQLQQSGVLAKNIFQSDICTYECHEDYFSARRLGIRSGRIFTGIMLQC